MPWLRIVSGAWLVLLCGVVIVRSLPPWRPPYDVLQHTDTRYVQHGDEGGLTLMCLKHMTMLEAISPITNITRPVTGISLLDCITPNSTYKEAFEALNINVSNITSMDIRFKEKRPLPPGNYMSELQLNFLSVRTEDGYDLFRNAKDFFDPVHNLSHLVVTGLRIPRLPTSMALKELTFYKGASIEEWGDCSGIESMHFLNVGDDVPRWPEECKNARELVMSWMVAANRAFENLTAAAPNLKSVKATDCSIHILPIQFLAAAQRLENLDLSNNELYDDAFTEFPLMKSLKTLNVGGNLYNGGFLKYVVPNVPALDRLEVSYNNNFDGKCVGESAKFKEALDYVIRSNFKEVSFFASHTELACFTRVHFSNLTLLELGYTELRKLKLLDLPTSDAENLTIDFDVTIFDEIVFNQADYETIEKENKSSHRNRHRLILNTRYITCDCNHGWLARGLRDFPNFMSMPDLKCDKLYGVSILEEDPDRLECEKWDEDKCSFKRLWSRKEVDAICYNQVLPTFKYPLRGLNVSGIELTSFYSNLPSTIQWIDYRNNLLSSANATTVSELFKNGRRVWLGGNQIICDCDNSLLLDSIQKHSTQVEDYETLTCIGTRQPISSISTAALCQTTLKQLMGCLAILIGIVLILIAIIRRYANEIRMFLFTRGWCIACLRQEDLDDKPFDAFISYAHGDVAFVRETLLPGLENAEEYRICIHYRDWQVGDWIPASIMQSVKQSKRTLIVLSRNFVVSTWSALEFKYAKLNAAQDKRSRLLILVLDDVLTQNLDPDLRAYLNYNNYLTCDDPWFWEKLKYAMPHKIKTKRGTKTKDIELNENYTGNVKITFPDNNNPLNGNLSNIQTECSN